MFKCFFYVSTLCSGCLQYMLCSHSNAPNNVLKWCQIATYLFFFHPCTLFSLFFCWSNKWQEIQHWMQWINGHWNSEHPTPITRTSDQLSLSNEVLKTLFNPTLQPHSYPSPIIIASFPFSSFSRQQCFKSSPIWVIVCRQPQCQVISFIRPVNHATSKNMSKIETGTDADST